MVSKKETVVGQKIVSKEENVVGSRAVSEEATVAGGAAKKTRRKERVVEC